MEWDLKRDYWVGPLNESGAGIGDVYDLWVNEAGLGEDEARRRLSEVALVGTGPAGVLCGVSTAYLQHNDQLGAELWHIRAFVSAPHRAGNLATNLFFGTQALTRERFLSGSHPDVPGAIIEVENPALQRTFPEAIWRPSGFAFVGESANGAHVRVYWFPGARAPEAPAAYG
jgi:hypothetical protein